MVNPADIEQFLGVFARYNQAVWPAQIVAYALGIGILIVAFGRTTLSGPLIGGVLALMWAFTGAMYHLVFFKAINRLAPAFGALFLVQAILLLMASVFRDRLDFRQRWNAYSFVGAVLILYAMVGYPLLGAALRHSYPRMPVFGIAPCPLVIFTFGVLLWADVPVRPHLLLIPVLWSLLGSMAALRLGMWEDSGLLLAGIVGTILVFAHNRHLRRLAVRTRRSTASVPGRAGARVPEESAEKGG